MYYEIVRSGTQYLWRIRGGNHEIVASSERLTTRPVPRLRLSAFRGAIVSGVALGSLSAPKVSPHGASVELVPMIPTWAELQAISDEELIRRYDGAARNTHVGTSFYQDEINRRAAERTNGSLVRLTRWITWLTVAVMVMTAVVVVLEIT